MDDGLPRLKKCLNRLGCFRMNRVLAKSATKASEPRSSRMLSETSKPDRARIRVLLADDHPVVRWGLSCFMAPHTELAVIGEAANGIEAVHKTKELHPDVVLMDIDMPELNGLAATEILRRENPLVKVLLLSMHPYTGQMARILQSGARGFLLKDTPPAEVVAAICKVISGTRH